MARTSTLTEARRRARARLAKAAEARRKRDQDELSALEDFEVAADRRRDAEADMARGVATLIALDNTVSKVAELTELSEAEVRRLRKLAATLPSDTPNPARGPAPHKPARRNTASATTAATPDGGHQRGAPDAADQLALGAVPGVVWPDARAQ